MKEDEKKFFITVYRLSSEGYNIRDISHILNEFVPIKRQVYLLLKWMRFGFYNYGVNILQGWFEDDKMPERYIELLER